MNTSEKTIERALIRMVQRHDGKCLKWVCPGWLGVPDRICLLPGGRIIFVETKRPQGGTRGAMQKKWAEWLTALGFIHRWVCTPQDITALDLLIYEMEDERDVDSV